MYESTKYCLQKHIQSTPNVLKHAPKHVLEEGFGPPHLVQFSSVPFISMGKTFGSVTMERKVGRTWNLDPSDIIRGR